MKTVLPPKQTLLFPVIATVNGLPTVNALDELPVQPFESVTTTEYVSPSVTVIDGVIAPLLHKYAVPPLAVKTALPPKHTLLFPVIATVNGLPTVNALDELPVQPFESVTTTEYVSASVTVIDGVVAPLLHK